METVEARHRDSDTARNLMDLIEIATKVPGAYQRTLQVKLGELIPTLFADTPYAGPAQKLADRAAEIRKGAEMRPAANDFLSEIKDLEPIWFQRRLKDYTEVFSVDGMGRMDRVATTFSDGLAKAIIENFNNFESPAPDVDVTTPIEGMDVHHGHGNEWDAYTDEIWVVSAADERIAKAAARMHLEMA